MSDFSDYSRFIGRMLLGIVCSAFITSMACSVLGPLALLISLILSLYANRRRKEFLSRHKRYSIVIGTVLALFIASIGFVVLNYVVLLIMTHGRYQGTPGLPPICYILAILMNVLLVWFVYTEHRRGVSYLNIAKLSTAVAFTIVFCFMAYSSLFHSDYFSGDEIFSNVDSLDIYDENLESSTSNISSNVMNSSISDTDYTFENENIASHVNGFDNTNSLNETSSLETDVSDMQQDNTEDVSLNQSMMSSTVLPNGITIDANGLPVDTENVFSSEQHNINVSAPSTENDAHVVNAMEQNEPFTQTSHEITDNVGMNQGHIIQTSPDTMVLQDQMSHNVATAHLSDNGEISITGNDGLSKGGITSEGNIQGTDGMSQGSVKDVNGTTVIKDSSGMMKVRITENGDIIGADGQTIGHVK